VSAQAFESVVTQQGRLVLEPKALLWEKICQEMSVIPSTVDLAQELIDERRESTVRLCRSVKHPPPF
jgi:hypothetical protein